MCQNLFAYLWNTLVKRKKKVKKTKYSFTSLWIQGTLPEYVRLCINSFLKNGHSYTLFTYGDFNIPGVTVRDAREILPERDIFRDHTTKSLAPFSDLFRWKWLYEEGGTWVDADVCCLKSKLNPLYPLDDHIEHPPYFCYEDNTCTFVSASYVQLPQHSLIAKYMYELSYDPLYRCPWETLEAYKRRAAYYLPITNTWQRKMRQEIMPWAYTSTIGLTNTLKHLYNTPFLVVASKALFPVHYKESHRLYDGSIRLKDINLKDTWAIHLWGHEMALHNYNIHTPTPSIMTDLLDRYGMCVVQ